MNIEIKEFGNSLECYRPVFRPTLFNGVPFGPPILRKELVFESQVLDGKHVIHNFIDRTPVAVAENREEAHAKMFLLAK